MFFFNMLKAILKKVDCVSNFADPPGLRRHHQYIRVYPKYQWKHKSINNISKSNIKNNLLPHKLF